MFAPMLQSVLGYPARDTGLIIAPRASACCWALSARACCAAGLPTGRLMLIGFAGAAVAIWAITGFSLQVDESTVVKVGFAQGFFYGSVSPR